MAGLTWTQLSTPVGEVSAGCGSGGIARVRFGPVPDGNDDHRALADAARAQLTEYFRGRRKAFDLPIDWSVTDGQQRHVLETLAASVGYGQTTSYGELARRSGLWARSDVLPARTVEIGRAHV